MRKLFIISLAFLLVMGIASIANADSVGYAQDVKNYPIVWSASVYNGSGATIVSGYIAEWDFDTADSSVNYNDDMCPYVQLADSAGDIWTAGVVPYGQNIPDGSSGEIIVRGPAYVVIGSTVTADDICEADANGKVAPHDGAATDEGTIGVAIKATTTNGPGSGFAIIWVNPTQYDKD